MKATKMLTILVLALGLMVWLSGVSEAVPMMGTAFTYQGRLIDANGPVDGLYDFEFKLWMDPCEIVYPPQVGDTLTMNDLDVIDGFFTVELDFNSPFAFNGYARWLEISVRPGDCNDVNDYVTLAPRQEVTPTPYALQTRGIFVDDRMNIGMGTTSPKGKLHVDGGKAADDTVASDITIKAQDGGDAVRGIRGGRGGDIILLPGEGGESPPLTKPGPSGKVGIGTAGPEAMLEVAGDMALRIEDDITLSLVSGISNSSKIALGQRFNNESAVIELDNTTSVLRFRRALDSNSLAIDNSGNVGIGTTSPTKRLEVAGDVTVKKIGEDVDMSLVSGVGSSSTLSLGNRFEPGAAAIKFDNLTQLLSFKNWLTDDALVITQDGNVGIGTKTPQVKLHVEGNARVSDDLSVQGKLTVDDAYVGSFPRPAYISGWASVTRGTNRTFLHHVGGDPNDYFVDVSFKTNSNKIHHFYYGTDGSWGAYWWDLDASQIKVFRAINDSFVDKVRVRIWVYK